MGTEFFIGVGVFPVEQSACQVSMFCTAGHEINFFFKEPSGS